MGSLRLHASVLPRHISFYISQMWSILGPCFNKPLDCGGPLGHLTPVTVRFPHLGPAGSAPRTQKGKEPCLGLLILPFLP